MRWIFLLLALLLAPVTVEAANRFVVCTTACTWDAADTTLWSAASGGATGASVPGSGDTVTLDAASCVGGTTCTVTVNGTVTVQSITMSACTASTAGCILDFSANNNNVTLTATAAFVSTSSGLRTLAMGNGTWTLTATSGTPWNAAGATNFTLTRNSSTIVFSGTITNNATFAGGAFTYGGLSFTGSGAVTITGANTFASLSQVGGTTFVFPGATTTVIDASPTITASVSSPAAWLASVFSSQATISIGSGTTTLTGYGIRGIAATGGATFVANSSLNLGNNSGITINAPAAGSGGFIIGGN